MPRRERRVDPAGEATQAGRPQLEELRASIDRMITDGLAGTPEVTAAADPVIMQLAAAGRGDDAVWLLRDALVPSPRRTWDVLRGLSAYGRREYLQWHRATVESLVSSLLAFDDLLRLNGVEADNLMTVIADTIRWRRDFALRTEYLGHRLARRDAHLREKITAFHNYRRQYANWIMHVPSPEEQRGRTKMFAEEVWLSPDYDELWQAAYGDLTYEMYVDEFGEPRTGDVLAALPSGAWLVEYWWYTHSTETKEERDYLVVRYGNDPQPTLAVGSLGPASATEVDDLADEIAQLGGGRGVRGRPSRDLQPSESPETADDFKRRCNRMRELVLDPLEVLGAETPRLFIVPDGPLTLTPFAALPTSRETYVCDSHVVSYLSNSADLVTSRPHAPVDATDAVVVGDVDFDVASTGTSSDNMWKPIPGTRREAEEVARRLGVSPITGLDATVDQLLAVRSPRVLHIATHGAMLPAVLESVSIDPRYPTHDALVDANSTARFGDIGFLAGRLIPYQELRSVIALAGANTWLMSGEHDTELGTGHVNAEDILDLNLDGTELVVLSACDTARGVLRLEEGVVGLRSSFRLAGAETTICSLWPVPDSATTELMIAFYDELTNSRPPDALRNAQLELREQYPDEPAAWAAFVCEQAVPLSSR